MIIKQCTKLKDLMDRVESLSTELISTCKKINENLQHAITSTTDQLVITKYMDQSNTMVNTVKEQSDLWA